MLGRLFSRSGLVSVAACALAGCATPDTVGSEVVELRFYAPHEIIVSASSTGVFSTMRGCVFFDRETGPERRAAALFPPGARLTRSGRAVAMPNGQTIPFNKRVLVELESNPVSRPLGEACGAPGVEIIQLRDKVQSK